MKTTVLFAAIALLANNGKGQVLNIPDANFKAYLLGNHAINTNKDGEIQYYEAVMYNGVINVSSKNISSLSGIEAFVYLKELYCSNNSITGINLYSNLYLTRLECDQNMITDLDVSNNTALRRFVCKNNKITSLDLKANVSLDYIDCSSNELFSLNLKSGHNNFIATLTATNNPYLSCIEVDDAVYMNTNFSGAKDAMAQYRVDCSMITALEKREMNVKTAGPGPNPTDGLLYFSAPSDVSVINGNGDLISTMNETNMVDLGEHPAGIYVVVYRNSGNSLVQWTKIIKR
jgi:hypothetical protein